MAATGVVEALDEAEDAQAGFCLGSEAISVEQLALECREEALAHRIVVGVADRACGWTNAGFPAAIAESNRRVLRASDALLFVKRRFAWR